ncbi:hypothetical protein [Burkholderia pseudomallei]|uniref:hypothetical protein n=1 Tax=Burkholderia pseudomallei TaxID=28450 RepID=UPI0030010628
MTINLMQACECMSTQPSVNARRAWLDACAAFEDARVTCGNPDLLRMAAFLERVATALWASDNASAIEKEIQDRADAIAKEARDRADAVAEEARQRGAAVTAEQQARQTADSSLGQPQRADHFQLGRRGASGRPVLTEVRACRGLSIS